MTYIFILLILFTIYIAVKSYLNKYGIMFLLVTISLIVMMYVAFSLIAMNGQYPTSNHFLSQLDKQIFTNIINKRSHILSLTGIYNVAVALFFCTITLLTNANTRKNKDFKIFSPVFFTVLIFSVTYCIFYHPDTILRFYVAIHRKPSYTFGVYLLDLLMHIGSWLILAYPVYVIVKRRNYLVSSYGKRQLFGFAGYLILTDILYLILSRISSLHPIWFLLKDQSIISVRRYTFRFEYEYLSYILIMLAAMVLNFYISSKYKVLHNDGIITNFFLKKKKDSMNKNFYQLLHGVKNIIFSYKITLAEALETQDPLEREQIICGLKTKVDDYLDHISSILNTNLALNSFYDSTEYASDVIDRVLEKLTIPDTITLEKHYVPQKEEIVVDTLYISEALYNIIENAIQALEQSNHEPKKLSIAIEPEFTWTVITIADNGVGMDRATQKHLFEPFYSSKSRIHNWGIGLYYAKNIVEQHKGKISVKSKPGKGTSIYILLPRI